MPTRYTAELMEKGQDFRAFALTCARAFGACIAQREEPANEPPKRRERSPYYTDARAKAKETVAMLAAMSPEQAAEHGSRLREQAITRATEYLARTRAENERLDAMAAQVSAWKPPSSGHNEMKAFMLQQISISKNNLSYSENTLAEAHAKTPANYYAEALRAATHDASYYEVELQKTLEHIASCNKWIDQLYASLPE